jgi:protein SCO1/2
MPSRKQLLFALTVVLAALVTGLSALWITIGERPRLPGSGTALIGGPFEMTDQNGKRVSDKDFLGKYALYFFGFTYCPDVCPSGLQVMSAALDEMGDAAKNIQPVFVTIDPGRDTPEVMKEYVSNFHQNLIGLTGSEADVAKIASVYRVYYAKREAKSGDPDYLMDHSALFYLMGPDGKFVRHFNQAVGVKDLVEGLKEATRS